MQTALQNPHYKKIWEKVIMNRHHEAKTLEEALLLEKKHPLCVLSFEGCLFTHNTASAIHSCQIALNQAECNRAKMDYVLGNVNDCNIFGRLITLEDILILCKGYFAGINLDISGIFKFNAIGQPANWSIIPWIFTKPLHEQTPETWEKIANLIN